MEISLPEEIEMKIEDLKLTYSELSITDSDLIFMGLRKLPMESVEELVKKLGYQAHVQLAEFQAKQKVESDASNEPTNPQ